MVVLQTSSSYLSNDINNSIRNRKNDEYFIIIISYITRLDVHTI